MEKPEQSRNMITEPMTMLTDYLLAGFLLFWGFYLSPENSDAVRFWSYSFIFSGIAAITGGSYHGFGEIISERKKKILWKITTISIGFTSYFMLIGSVHSSIRDEQAKFILSIISLFTLVVYIYWMLDHDKFIYVILYYAPAMLVVIVLKIYSYFTFNDESSVLLIIGVIIAYLGAGIQASGKGFHKNFNNNDIFHIIQIISAYFLFLGVLRI